MARQIVMSDYGSYTITGTAGLLFTFADAGMPSSIPTGARSFRGKLETASVRMRGDGTAPTASEGELQNIGDPIVLSEHDLNALQFIRTGGTSGVLKGHFYNVEADVLLGGG